MGFRGFGYEIFSVRKVIPLEFLMAKEITILVRLGNTRVLSNKPWVKVKLKVNKKKTGTMQSQSFLSEELKHFTKTDLLLKIGL